MCFALTALPPFLAFPWFTGGLWVFAATWAASLAAESLMSRAAGTTATENDFRMAVPMAASICSVFLVVKRLDLGEAPDLAVVLMAWPLIGGMICGIEDAHLLRDVPLKEMPSRALAYLRRKRARDACTGRNG